MSCQALRNIPKMKLDLVLKDLEKIEDQEKRSAAKKAILRYYESNIPVKYWTLEMNKHFHGDPTLKEYYDGLVCDIDSIYKDGIALCFAGGLGRGKTLTVTNILKRAVEKGYKALYVTLGDIVSIQKTNDSFLARQELFSVDFLTIDEFDPRYMATDSAADFYGRVLEDILRTRSNNKMPIFMCTNSPNVEESFKGDIKNSLSSLMNYVKTIPVLGSDFRKQEKDGV